MPSPTCCQSSQGGSLGCPCCKKAQVAVLLLVGRMWHPCKMLLACISLSAYT